MKERQEDVRQKDERDFLFLAYSHLPVYRFPVIPFRLFFALPLQHAIRRGGGVCCGRSVLSGSKRKYPYLYIRVKGGEENYLIQEAPRPSTATGAASDLTAPPPFSRITTLGLTTVLACSIYWSKSRHETLPRSPKANWVSSVSRRKKSDGINRSRDFYTRCPRSAFVGASPTRGDYSPRRNAFRPDHRGATEKLERPGLA